MKDCWLERGVRSIEKGCSMELSKGKRVTSHHDQNNITLHSDCNAPIHTCHKKHLGLLVEGPKKLGGLGRGTLGPLPSRSDNELSVASQKFFHTK